jgi:hypothetical protein
MLGTGTTRPHPDAPDQADDLIGYLRRGPRELPPGIPQAPQPRRIGRPVIPALACVAALAGLLVGCQITKQTPTHSASPSSSGSQPSTGGTGALPSPHTSSTQPSAHPSTKPTPHATSSQPAPHASSTLPAPAPSGSLFALPATSGQLSVEVSARVFAARTLQIRVDVSTPQANTLRQTLDGPISVTPDGTLTGNATGTADRFNGVHVSAPLIFLPYQLLYIAPPAHLMPAGKTWALITPADANGRASWAARESAYVLYASATSWNLLRYATTTTKPHWSGSGASARAHMAGTAVLATVLPHATPGARDAVLTFAGPGTTDITWDVLLDSRLLPVSCVITARSPGLGPITATVTYSGWGTAVQAAPPPASDVATYSQLPPYLREVSQ